MIQVKPGQKIPLSATIGDRTAGLVVKATLEKMDGTLLTTITLTEVHSGDHMDFSYSMPYDLPFIKAKFRVYDSDGTTPNTNNGDSEEIFGVVLPLLVKSLKVKLECEAQTAPILPVIVQTSDEAFDLSFVDENGVAVDTSSASSISVKMKKADATVMTKSLGSGITTVNLFLGKYLLSLLAADFALLSVGDVNVQAIVVMAGVNHVVQLMPGFTLEASIV